MYCQMARYDEEDQGLLLDRVIPSPGILRMRKIRLWIAVIIVVTVVGAMFLITSTKIHSQSRAYMIGQYRVKDTKVGFISPVLHVPETWLFRFVHSQSCTLCPCTMFSIDIACTVYSVHRYFTAYPVHCCSNVTCVLYSVS